MQCVVTSPPYWGLRDYGTAKWDGGEPNCDHKVAGQVQDNKAPGAIQTGQRPGVDSSRCRKCGARRIDQQIGLESTPEEYIAKMVEVFREVRRVLRDDGTLWINIGDSYAASPGQRKTTDAAGPKQLTNAGAQGAPSRSVEGLKPKDLVGIPWMLAFALRADGWYLRQDIIWSKPNPMPESVRDRCTKAHEYIFLLTKSQRYYYDQEAILEPVSLGTYARLAQNVEAQIGSERANGGQKTNGNMKAVARGLGAKGKQADPSTTRSARGEAFGRGAGWRKLAAAGSGTKNNSSFDEAMAVMPDKRNKRSVWEIATQPYSEAHFATFPESLVEPCILAGSKPGDAVLDPFCGSGTTGAVALRYHRDFVGVELNPEYAELASKRIGSEAPMFNQVEVSTP